MLSKTKTCIKCKIEKPLNEFSKRKNSKDGYRNECKECRKLACSKYFKSHKEKWKFYRTSYFQFHKEKKKLYDKNYRKSHQEEIKNYQKNYRKNKRLIDELYKFKGNLRTLIRNSFKKLNYTKKSKTYEILGISYQECLKYLFDKAKKRYPDFKPEDFLETNNYHIDHIIPLATAKNEEELMRLCHYTNIQLLTKEDNLIKHDKLDWN